jgi:hypothetical protein
MQQKNINGEQSLCPNGNVSFGVIPSKLQSALSHSEFSSPQRTQKERTEPMTRIVPFLSQRSLRPLRQ